MHTVTIDDIDAKEDNLIVAGNEIDDLGKEEQKSRFILLRAKGLSYAKIRATLRRIGSCCSAI